MTTPLDLDAIRARAQAATDGPWAFHDFGYEGEQEPSSIAVHTGKFDHTDLREYESQTAIAWMPRWEAQESDNAAFIAHARTDIPALLTERDRLAATVDRVRALVADTGNTSTGPTYALCADVLAAIEGTDS